MPTITLMVSGKRVHPLSTVQREYTFLLLGSVALLSTDSTESLLRNGGAQYWFPPNLLEDAWNSGRRRLTSLRKALGSACDAHTNT